MPTGNTSESVKMDAFSNNPLPHYSPALPSPPKILHNIHCIPVILSSVLRKLKDILPLLKCGHKIYIFNINPPECCQYRKCGSYNSFIPKRNVK